MDETMLTSLPKLAQSTQPLQSFGLNSKAIQLDLLDDEEKDLNKSIQVSPRELQSAPDF